MNVPVDNEPNDLNRGPPAAVGGDNSVVSSIRSFVTQVIAANSEWTDAKDFAVRLAVPLFGIAATAMFNRYLKERERQIDTEETSLRQAQAELCAEKKAFEAEKGMSFDRPIANVVDDLMAQRNRVSWRALQEIDELQPMIKDILKVRCSVTTSKERREPLEKDLRTRLLREPSPFDGHGTLKADILEDTIDIVRKDVAHCDLPWPFGNGNDGELYKVYRHNWRLRVELEKHKHVIEQLKRSTNERRKQYVGQV